MSNVGWDDVWWLWRAWRIKRAMKRGAPRRAARKEIRDEFAAMVEARRAGAPTCCRAPMIRVFSRNSWHCPCCHYERPQ